MDNSQAAPLNETVPESQAPPRRQILLEALMLLAVLYVPRLYGSLFLGSFINYLYFPDWSYEVYTQLHVLAFSAIILYLLWSGGESFRDFGIRKIKPTDLVWGALLMGASYVVMNYPFYGSANGFGELSKASFLDYLKVIWRCVAILPWAFFQALYFRAYFVRRTEQLGYRPILGALMGSVLIWVMQTDFFGPRIQIGGILDPSFLRMRAWLDFGASLILGIAYWRLRSVWPLVIASVGVYAVALLTMFNMLHWF